MVSIEKITHLGPMIEGQHQGVYWGNPYVQFYCFDQLKQQFKRKLPEVFKECERLGFIKTNVNFDEMFNEK